MNINAAVKILEGMVNGLISSREDLRDTNPMKDVLTQRIEALEMVLKLIRSENNIPLSVNDLQEMRGTPIYIDPIGWHVCYGINYDAKTLNLGPTAVETVSMYDYNKTWRAYRSEPDM